ncbi:hypothetical protein [Candidatus Chromulinivorax destructor]|uniref:Uncharacterized protein n=1 Tax=Candidatus Chromulinivorax destructor TaxID=2066483 RepID=A0A345ZA21_9BACT|nr:hypothetical protein [Candidatus Chromulinivorax destructor]AXK60138.1 hypothetical protein C0J27_00030 [Candidatus Chromulinivorax destructor]
MQSHNLETKETKLLKHLGNLRKMIVNHHDLDNLSEFVLHDLCGQSCFNLNKAAYFINNPDFRCLQGVSGYHEQDVKNLAGNAWDNKKLFMAHMQNSPFNQKVRSNSTVNFEKGKASEKYMADKLADELEINNPLYVTWDLKHANHGLLIYEAPEQEIIHVKDHLFDALYYLSFCPVFLKA